MSQHYEYAVTERGRTPGPKAILFATYREATDALWSAKETAPKHYVADDGTIKDTNTDFVIHARLVLDGWKVVDSEQEAEPSADPVA